ncbi:MAG: TIGR03619 family F420-dependent LLM class oxidoreductase [Acidimicrobiia bacterium]|nr:TIGR03619 family F420-dependent LLM class oxidoreductase [Acidimicrobiia bacterium]
MKLGIVTPVVTRLPDAHAQWEGDGGIAEIERVVVEAERLGYEFATCSEHVAVPRAVARERGGTYWDPLAVFGYLAARTTTIGFATFVLVLGYHHPLAIVKRYGTLDVVSGGRLILGVGVGSLSEEFDLLGAEMDGRGERGDDAIRAIRASFSHIEPSYHGTHYSFDDFMVEPAGVQADVPIWIGGRTARSLRRAVDLAHAWAPFAIARNDLAEMLERASQTEAWNARTTPLEVIIQTTPPLDPLGAPDDTKSRVDRLEEAGITGLALRFVHHSVDHYCEQLAAMREVLNQ